MGDMIKHIYDRYDTYVEMCRVINREPVDIRGKVSFLDEIRHMLKKYKCDDEYEFFIKISKKNKSQLK